MRLQEQFELRNAPSPFLKWAGGKRWLVERHADLFPEFDGEYIEPFLGGGSVFFHLQPEHAYLSDTNSDLIQCYRQIRDDHKGVIACLKEHQLSHSESHYYKIRAADFNDPSEKAAKFLYLNRTCFNGLYRVNKLGAFNVPIGTKTKVFDPNEDFEAVVEALGRAELSNCDFEISIDRAKEGDFLFVDPPYTVKHNTNGFLKYNEKIFSWDDQERLKAALVRAAERGAKVLMTNAAHESVLALYAEVGQIQRVSRASVLAGKRAARGTFEEIVVRVG